MKPDQIQNAWEDTDPVTNVVAAISYPSQPGKTENEGNAVLLVKRAMLVVNTLAVLVCTGLLFNRTSVCIER